LTTARTEAEAHQVANSIARSPLFKCAVHGGDPNWGRVLCAAGYSGADIDQTTLALTFGPVRGIDEAGGYAPYRGGIERDLTTQELKAAPAINTLTSCFRNIYRGAPVPLYVRTSTIGDLMVWAMLG